MVEVGVISIFCHVPHLVSGWIQVAAANSCTPMCPPSCNYFLISVASQQIKLYISETYSRNGRGHVISVVLLAVVRSSVLMSGVAVICVCISCHAVTDVLRGRPLDDIVDDLPVVWETCFRVRDDIKVCLSPASVCLSSVCQRLWMFWRYLEVFCVSRVLVCNCEQYRSLWSQWSNVL